MKPLRAAAPTVMVSRGPGISAPESPSINEAAKILHKVNIDRLFNSRKITAKRWAIAHFAQYPGKAKALTFEIHKGC